MSDLLPLVLTTIRDKAIVDALDELEQLKKERDASRTIEVIRSNDWDKEEHSDMMVYASASIRRKQSFQCSVYVFFPECNLIECN